MFEEENQVLSVSTLTNQIRNQLENNFNNIEVQGEISNYKLHSSGHTYFSLKDDKAQIRCVLWRARKINFKPTDGMKVYARGNISLYPPQGSYQLDCLELRQVGQGDLYIAFEKLKKKLSDAGYFDQARKTPLPKIPLSIGISTSPTGAAVQDMISTLKRRLPFVKVYFRPTLVQGDGSAQDIVKAIEELSKTPAEVIIIGRGGGSIEDLWSYNTEIVAEAIYKCKKPIISAVGHETDFTIADFVSDLRAPTPTGAAEMASPITFADLDYFFSNSRNTLERNIMSKISNLKEGILERFPIYSTRRILNHIRKNSQFVDQADSIIQNSAKSNVRNAKSNLERLESHLKSLHPFSPLDKGFAILKENDNYITSEKSISDLDEIEIIRKIETVRAKIIK